MRTSKRSGFTLIELLVVITIISMLMAMLLPAVNHATEAVRRANCMNNLRQLAMGVREFESKFLRFPGYQQKVGARDATWVITMLPYISEQRLFDTWKDDGGVASTPQISVLLCPSDPPPQNDQPFLAYVANAGLNDVADNTVYNGVFHDLLNTNTRMTMDAFHDGDTKTMLFSENIQATRWNELGKEATVFVWHDVPSTAGNPTLQINGNKKSVQIGSTTLPGEASRPSSFHSGGVNAVYGDGHANFLMESIDYKVYVQLMTPYGERCTHTTPAFRDYILTAADTQ